MDSVKNVDEINNTLRARAGTNGQNGVKSEVESMGRWSALRIGKSDMRYWAKFNQYRLLSLCGPGRTHPKGLLACTVRVSRICPQAACNKTYKSGIVDWNTKQVQDTTYPFVCRLQSTAIVPLAIRLDWSHLFSWNSGQSLSSEQRLNAIRYLKGPLLIVWSKFQG